MEWALLQAQALRATAGIQLESNLKDEALASVSDAQLRLEKLQQKNKTDVRIAAQLANTMLTRADIESSKGEAGKAAASCSSAIAILGKSTADSADFRLLDPWVRAQLCLHRGAAASAAITRLGSTGYREEAYMKYLSTHH
jgi:hypothetical protein